MSILGKYQNIIMAGVIVVVAFVAYSYFFTGKEEAVLVQEGPSVQSDIDKDLIALLFELKQITLDDSIFSNKSFQSLEDFSKELVTEPIGRNNPFAPITGSGSTQQVSVPKK
jgi:hypothetical protein